jgi:hypothetical protein
MKSENAHARLTIVDVARAVSFTTIYTVADVRFQAYNFAMPKERHAKRKGRNTMTDLNSSILWTRPRKHKGVEHDAAIMLRVPGELRIQVESAAKAEFMPVAAWVRRAMRAELRRKVRL